MAAATCEDLYELEPKVMDNLITKFGSQELEHEVLNEGLQIATSEAHGLGP